jgi:hypothetical protein
MDGSNGGATCVCLANGTGLPGAASGAGQTLCDEGLQEEDGGAAELHPILLVGEAGDESSTLSPKNPPCPLGEARHANMASVPIPKP